MTPYTAPFDRAACEWRDTGHDAGIDPDGEDELDGPPYPSKFAGTTVWLAAHLLRRAGEKACRWAVLDNRAGSESDPYQAMAYKASRDRLGRLIDALYSEAVKAIAAARSPGDIAEAKWLLHEHHRWLQAAKHEAVAAWLETKKRTRVRQEAVPC